VRKKKSAAARRGRQRRRTGLRRLNKLHERLIKLPNTFATYVGQPSRKGKWAREVAIVCLVVEKKPPSRLQRSRRIPALLSWSESKRAKRRATDVLQVKPRFVAQAGVLGPGDGVMAGGKRATVGVALMHPQLGACVTTAAHLFETAGIGATVKVSRDGTSTPVEATVRDIDPLVDYALLRAPEDTPCGNVFDDEEPLGAIFAPGEADVGSTVFVLLSTGQLQQTVCRGIHAAITTPRETMQDCILTDMVTLGGDSGTCLVDKQLRIWGVLRGRLDTTFSVFAPVHYILEREGATLL
jgi:hypothetical protein